MTHTETSGARTRARELLLQALYQQQIAGHDADELLGQFHGKSAYQRADRDYFDELLPAICAARDALEAKIDEIIDRPLVQLDPVELAILLIGVHELTARVDVPYRVVINEGVNLAKRFGASDSHKYINACLDAASRSIREGEVAARDGTN